jgi:hypothetical protein
MHVPLKLHTLLPDYRISHIIRLTFKLEKEIPIKIMNRFITADLCMNITHTGYSCEIACQKQTQNIYCLFLQNGEVNNSENVYVTLISSCHLVPSAVN